MHYSFFFFNDTATTEIYTLSLHDALPISLDCGRSRAHRVGRERSAQGRAPAARMARARRRAGASAHPQGLWQQAHRRSEEHTSELQSRQYLVCRLLLEKKKKHKYSLSIASNYIYKSNQHTITLR